MSKFASVLSAIMFAVLLPLATANAATASANVWWPTNNVSLDGVQPFKAVVDGRALDTYNMFWQVDNGGYVKMTDSQTDYPHKEAMVDLSGWNWNSSGSYAVNFIAQDLSGNEIARTAMTIRHGASLPPDPIVPQATTPTVTQTTILPTNPTAPVAPVSVQTATSAPTPSPTVTARLAIQVSQPLEGSTVSGVQTLKAVLGSNLSAYKMYWSVDGGGQNEMSDSYVGYPHKEAVIDFSGWTWKGNDPYTLNLTAKDLSGNVVGTASVSVYANKAQTSVTTTAPVVPAVTASVATNGTKLFVDPNNPATAQAKAWASSDPSDSAVMAKIGAQATAIWLGGWNANVQSDVTNDMAQAAAQSAIPTFVAYNIPGRDCGSYSAGGASDAASYIAWIKQVSAGIGSGKAMLVLEPDGLANIDCMSASQQTDRYSMISQALDIFKADNPSTKVYLDAGNSGWIDSTTMAGRLNKAGIAKAAGFSLNVSNFFTTASNEDYGARVSSLTNGAHFIVDTSRNGNGSNSGQWCNPSGMALGQTPTTSTGNSLVDALLWVKQPGESDGSCNGAPAAGGWWPQYALGLAKAAGWY